MLRWDDEQEDQPIGRAEAEPDTGAESVDGTDDLEIADGNEDTAVATGEEKLVQAQAGHVGARQLFKCKRCGRRIAMPAEGPMFDLQCSCGGKMRAV